METMREYIVDEAKAVVLVIHGSGEHIGRYEHVAEWLNKYKISMVGGDLPGLGTSKEKKGHIEEFEDYLDKVEDWIEYIQKMWPDKPIFLLGHSLGGLIVLRYLQEIDAIDEERIKGAILSSPAVSIGIDIPKWQLSVANILKNFLPTFRLKSGIEPYQVSRDKYVVEQYSKDPLNYPKVSVNWFFEFNKAIDEAWDDMKELKGISILYMQAERDLLVKPDLATKFVERANEENGDNITYHIIPEAYHEIFNEPNKEEAFNIMTDWLNAHL